MVLKIERILVDRRFKGWVGDWMGFEGILMRFGLWDLLIEFIIFILEFKDLQDLLGFDEFF